MEQTIKKILYMQELQDLVKRYQCFDALTQGDLNELTGAYLAQLPLSDFGEIVNEAFIGNEQLIINLMTGKGKPDEFVETYQNILAMYCEPRLEDAFLTMQEELSPRQENEELILDRKQREDDMRKEFSRGEL